MEQHPSEPDYRRFMLSYQDFPLERPADAVRAVEGAVILEREGDGVARTRSSLPLEAAAPLLGASLAEAALSPGQRHDLAWVREALLVGLGGGPVASVTWEQARQCLDTALARGMLAEEGLLATLVRLLSEPAASRVRAACALLEALDELGASEPAGAAELVRGLGPWVVALGEFVLAGRVTLPDGSELVAGKAPGPEHRPGLGWHLVRVVSRRLG